MTSAQRIAVGLGALAIALSKTFSATAEDAQRNPLPSFRDTFETLDEERWLVSDGWTNGEFSNVGWSRKQVGHRQGRIDLHLVHEPSAGKPFSAGEIQSRAWGGYGRYEAAVRAAAGGEGMVTGFFVYTGPYFDMPHDEIDFEWLGKDTHAVQVNYYSDGRSAGGKTVSLPYDAAADFYIYRFDWLPDRIDWYVDGDLVHSEDGRKQRLPKPPAKLIADIWTGTGKDLETWLGGTYEQPAQPVTASIRCVSYVPLNKEGVHCSDRP